MPNLAGQHFVDYNTQSRLIYQDIINLQLDRAEIKIEQLKNQEPMNLSYIHLSSYKDFFKLFISEDETVYKILKKNREQYLKALDRLDDGDPYKAFIKAEVMLHWAIIRSKFGELFKASREVLKASKLLQENKKEHPEFILNDKSLSIIHALAETITLPGIFKKLLGLEGSIAQGISEIQGVIQHYESEDGGIFKEELDAIYLYINLYQAKNIKETISYLPHCNLDPKTSPMAAFLLSKIHQRTDQNDKAIAVLKNRPTGEGYEDFWYLEFSLGVSLLKKLDPAASTHLNNFVKNFSGRHYIKEAYQKLGWHALVINEDFPSYKKYMALIDAKGHTLVDGDKQAQEETQQTLLPDPLLLKARLLYDGGYFHEAFSILIQNAYKWPANDYFHLEYLYRLGRVTQALKNYREAIQYFEETLSFAAQSNQYYICNAALQIGLIYETQGRLDIAEKYFKQCLSLKPNQYKTSLHQKAKSGLVRVADRRDGRYINR